MINSMAFSHIENLKRNGVQSRLSIQIHLLFASFKITYSNYMRPLTLFVH